MVDYNIIREVKAMKIFLITLKNYSYDEYDSCVIVAKNKKQVRDFCLNGFESCEGENFFIYGGQQVEKIEEVGVSSKYTKPTIICSSFNAG